MGRSPGPGCPRRPVRPYPWRMTDTALTLQDRSDATLSPVLGRYFQRAWARGAGHRLYDS
jgi:hypothetical protein